MGTQQALVKEWDATGLALTAQLFRQAEAARRSLDGHVPPGMVSWDDDDMIQIVLRFFEAKGLPAPKLSKQAWHMLWVKHEHEAGNYIDAWWSSKICKRFLGPVGLTGAAMLCFFM